MKRVNTKEQIELEKKYWLQKIFHHLDKRIYRDVSFRELIIKDIMEFDKCCLIEDYFVNVHWGKNYSNNIEFLKNLEVDRKDFEENGLSLYSKSGRGLNPFMINKWYKDYKNEILKRI